MKAIALLLATCLVASLATDAPIICIFTLPMIEQVGKYNSFIQAEAVKFIEASGGRVVVLRYTDDPNNLVALLHQCNGLFIPSYNEESANSVVLDA